MHAMSTINFLFKISSLLFSTLIITPALSQVREVRNAPSAEVANLGTFGTIPVGHYTGTPNISIPLYTITVGNINIPIQATYHTANVKPHTPPSCLGIGWALSVGGYIARNVRGVQDEKETYLTTEGYYFNHNKITELEGTISETQKDIILTPVPGKNWYELAADEFSFNFNGYSGMFFMDKDGLWRVVSDDNIKVEFNENGGFKTIDDLKKRFSLQYYNVSDNKRFFDKFTLITSDGTRYEFGGANATEYSVPYYNQVDGDIMATCWRLSKITTTDNRVVTFEYAADSYMCDIHYAPQMVNIYKDNKGYGTQCNTGRTGYSGFLTMPSRLLKISSEYETVSFRYSRDNSYGNLFLKNSGCLFWYDNQYGYYDNNYRYSYGQINDEFKVNRFSVFMGVHPLKTEGETRQAIANKITQDYLSGISVQVSGIKTIDIAFNFDIVRLRRLLSSIKFNTIKRIAVKEDIDSEEDADNDYSKKVSGDILCEEESKNSTELTDTLNLRNNSKVVDKLNAVITSPMNYLADVSHVETEDNTIYGEEPEIEMATLIKDDIAIDVSDFPFDQKDFEYRFEYYKAADDNALWPQRNPLTYTDSWGYYSRSGSNPSNSGEWQLGRKYTESEFGKRLASLIDTRNFVLKDIIYPTGGKTSFEYELNDYSKQFDIKSKTVKDAKGYIGGLRVKSIGNYDTDGSLLYSVDYIYKNTLNGNSSGISKGEPCFYDKVYLNKNKSDYIEIYSFDNISPYPLNFNTPDVGYSTVFEELKDKNGQLISRTKYQYTNYDIDINNKSHIDSPAFYTANVFDSYASAPFTSMAFERGKLTSKEVMDAGNNVLEKNTYEYIRSEGMPYTTISHEYHRDIYQNLFAFSYMYKTYANRYLVSVNKKQQKMDSGYFNCETHYQYNNFGIPVLETLKANNGDIVSTSYQYSFDSPAYSWMKDKNILLPTAVSKTHDDCTTNEITHYSQSTSGAPYVSGKETIWTAANPGKTKNRMDFTVERADDYGNPIVWNENGIKTIMIWSYKGRKLVATIQNATYEEVKTALGKAPEYFSGLSVPVASFDDLRNKLNEALVFTYSYDNRLNLTSKTDPNGFSHTYSYDTLGRLTAEHRKDGNETELLKSYKYNYSTKE